jgi:hypothetical protein
MLISTTRPKNGYLPDLVGFPFEGALQVYQQGFVRAGGDAEALLGHGREDVLEHFAEDLVVILRLRAKLPICCRVYPAVPGGRPCSPQAVALIPFLFMTFTFTLLYREGSSTTSQS